MHSNMEDILLGDVTREREREDTTRGAADGSRRWPGHVAKEEAAQESTSGNERGSQTRDQKSVRQSRV